uniref:DNA-(apurinic or apyrimidinic site) lyase n=1 Tax=Peronospora matthiolae TaxID=2874970 RepID=A0AAV1TN01_9STRA
MRRSSRVQAAVPCHIKTESSRTTSSCAALCSSPAGTRPLKAPVPVEKCQKGPDWTPLCSTRVLSCALTLESGQVFAWQRHPRQAATWLGVLNRRVFALQERDHVVHFRCLHPADVAIADGAGELSHYFRLDMDAELLYDRWTARADRMSASISRLRGLRIVRQDPVECLFAFICSSNNNIARIQTMVDKLRATYGDLIYEGDGYCLYAFPPVDTLAVKCEETTLRALGFGYRAAFVVKTAKQLQELGGASYLHSIRDEKVVHLNEEQELKPQLSRTRHKEPSGALQGDITTSYHAYQDDLMVFAGVGRKVADCVALFSLEKLEAIPVDTHVWQIACRELDATLSDRKSITPSVYRMVGDLFRTRFAPQAGWAHSILFAGDLTAFKPELLGTSPRPPQVKRKFQNTTSQVPSTHKKNHNKKHTSPQKHPPKSTTQAAAAAAAPATGIPLPNQESDNTRPL